MVIARPILEYQVKEALRAYQIKVTENTECHEAISQLVDILFSHFPTIQNDINQMLTLARSNKVRRFQKICVKRLKNLAAGFAVEYRISMETADMSLTGAWIECHKAALIDARVIGIAASNTAAKYNKQKKRTFMPYPFVA